MSAKVMEFAITACRKLMTPDTKDFRRKEKMSFSLIFALILLSGWAGGRLAKAAGIPSVIGMIAGGFIISLCCGKSIPDTLWGVEPFLKSLALIIILLRAGLGINRKILLKSGRTTILMSVVPCLAEGLGLLFVFHFWLGYSYAVAGMAAFILSAVSPAVIVPSMLDLHERGYGVKKQVPSVILAGASVDNVLSITIFTLFMKFYTIGGQAAILELEFIPYTIGMGIALGVIFGMGLVWLFRRIKPFRATEKVMTLLGICLVLVALGDVLHIAALLGAMTVGFVLFEKENHIAGEIAGKLSKIWVWAEIVLFVLIGMALNPKFIVSAGWKGIVIVLAGLVLRSLGVIIATASSRFNRREKLFCVIAYLPKATVQAALGAVPLSLGVPEGGVILATAIISILLTAPLGLFLITRYGSVLLKKQ